MTPFASIDDLQLLWRPLKADEKARAEALLQIVTDALIVAGQQVGKDLVAPSNGKEYASVLKSVTCDVVARTLMTSTNQEPMTQMAQSAGGYSTSGTFLVPGGGLFIKKSELARLGLRRQKVGVIGFYDDSN